MYNLSDHYQNIYRYLQTIITDPRLAYLHPFGSTQPENLEILHEGNNQKNNSRHGPMFIFYDQEPLNFLYNKKFFDHLVSSTKGPYVLVNTERRSEEKIKICDHYGFADLDYFFHIFAAADWYRGHRFDLRILDARYRHFKKTYITLNRLTSNERVYRALLINSLHKKNLLSKGYVSFSKYCPDGGYFADNLCLAVDNKLIPKALAEESISNINSLQDLRIDFQGQDIPNQSMLLEPIAESIESFVFVVTETCFWQNKTHLTEKIFKPIVLKMPFILVGCPHNLSYLRDYGFRTFSDYWSEEYDQIEDPLQRLESITDVLQKLNNLSTKKQRDMYLDMLPILEHNYKIFNDPSFVNREWHSLLQKLKDISKFYQYQPPYKLDLKTKQSIPLDPI